MKISPEFKNSIHFTEFWSKGNGKELIDWSASKVSFKKFEEFAPFYFQVDELGDAAVRDLYLKKSFKQASEELSHYIKNGISGQEELPESIKNLFRQVQEVPDWVDFEVLEKGAALNRRSGINSLIVLRDYTLMGGYDYAYLTKPLIHTGALKKGAVKRLADTLDFWVNVTRKSALRQKQKGYEMCIKTRLIHSYSRLMILEKSKNWDTEKYGKPINSWDMMATYIGFSLIFLHGLKKLKIHFNEEEELGHFHLWKYIGYLLGIPPEILPNNKKEATEYFYLWTAIQPPSDQDSVLLAKSLLDENLESTILKYQFQRKNLRYLHICMNWFLLDQEVNERLKIPKVIFKNIFPNMLITQNTIFQKVYSRENQIEKGGKFQEKVLEDYLRTAPRNIHH